MNTRRTFLSLLGLTALMSATTALATTTLSAKAKVGEAAPNFTLTDTDGAEHTLADYKGKIVVMQWINPECPVCNRVSGSGLTRKMITELKGLDTELVVLAINSTAKHAGNSSISSEYLKKHKIRAMPLLDGDGSVGHLYGARTTPHVFVIDTEGVLRYAGAFDSDPMGKKDDATNYAVNAVRQIVEGETVAPDHVKPYGCSVKYAKD